MPSVSAFFPNGARFEHARLNGRLPKLRARPGCDGTGSTRRFGLGLSAPHRVVEIRDWNGDFDEWPTERNMKMSDAQWKLLVRFMLFVLDRLVHISSPTSTARVEAEQLKGDLENQPK